MSIETARALAIDIARPAYPKIVVSHTRKGWRWEQVARNGSAGAVSPKLYDTRSSAVRAALRQASLLGGAPVEVRE